MTLDIYQIDAFTHGSFSGNPAAVVPLTEWLADDILQSIALENNLSETAYFIPENGGYKIRWFTPIAEVDLCGHATLAAAKVIFDVLEYPNNELIFSSKSGLLYVYQDKDLLSLNFPTDELHVALEHKLAIEAAIGCTTIDVYRGLSDFLCILASATEVINLQPNFIKLMELEARGLLVSARANQKSDYDIISRCFFPRYGINEDPVTGSAHTTIIPYWYKKLGRTTFDAFQASYRGGLLKCEYLGDRISLQGRAHVYMIGKIFI